MRHGGYISPGMPRGAGVSGRHPSFIMDSIKPRSPQPSAPKGRHRNASSVRHAGQAPAKRNWRASRTIATCMIVAICALELWGLSQYFPPNAYLNAHPFYTDSYALHFARRLIGEAALVRHLRLWSYSPNLMAGYPAGTRTEPMGAAPRCGFGYAEVFSTSYRSDKPPFCTNCWWWDCWRASRRRWHWRRCGSASIGGWRYLAAILGALGDLQLSRHFDDAGGDVWLPVRIISLRGVGRVPLPYLNAGRAWRFALLAAAGGAITYLHPLSAFLLAPPALAGLAMSRGSRRGALALSLAGSLILSLDGLARCC